MRKIGGVKCEKVVQTITHLLYSLLHALATLHSVLFKMVHPGWDWLLLWRAQSIVQMCRVHNTYHIIPQQSCSHAGQPCIQIVGIRPNPSSVYPHHILSPNYVGPT